MVHICTVTGEGKGDGNWMCRYHANGVFQWEIVISYVEALLTFRHTEICDSIFTIDHNYNCSQRDNCLQARVGEFVRILNYIMGVIISTQNI